MKSPDRDAADELIERLEGFAQFLHHASDYGDYAPLIVTAASELATLRQELLAEKQAHLTACEQEIAAKAELATLRRRVAEMEAVLGEVYAAHEKRARYSFEDLSQAAPVFNDDIWRKEEPRGFELAVMMRAVLAKTGTTRSHLVPETTVKP